MTLRTTIQNAVQVYLEDLVNEDSTASCEETAKAIVDVVCADVLEEIESGSNDALDTVNDMVKHLTPDHFKGDLVFADNLYGGVVENLRAFFQMMYENDV